MSTTGDHETKRAYMGVCVQVTLPPTLVPLPTGNHSVTPVLVWALNLPPWVRYRHGLVHLALLLPKGIKNQAMLEPFLCELKSVGPGSTGLEVWDGHDCDFLTIFYGLVNGCHDLRALPHYVRQWQTPAITGACHWCGVTGTKLSSSATAYHEGIRNLAMGDPLRTRHGRLFEDSKDEICRCAGELPPLPRNTRDKVRAAMRRAEQEATEQATKVGDHECAASRNLHRRVFAYVLTHSLHFLIRSTVTRSWISSLSGCCITTS